MINGKKIVVVMPAYNAEKTLEQTYNEIPFDIVDEVILTDDFSKDNTVGKAQELGITTLIRHERNKGYGGNQKTCYNKALELGADIVIMVHPDYQYTPETHSLHGIHDCQWGLSRGLCIAHLGQRRSQRGNAADKIRRQPISHTI